MLAGLSASVWCGLWKDSYKAKGCSFAHLLGQSIQRRLSGCAVCGTSVTFSSPHSSFCARHIHTYNQRVNKLFKFSISFIEAPKTRPANAQQPVGFVKVSTDLR
jgi:hypothetical protein